MQLIGSDKIVAAYEKHPGWKASLKRWAAIVAMADWSNFVDLRQSFANASAVGKYVIFNIAHNEARLVSLINYPDRRVMVTEILTHAEYDGRNFKT